jgi:hypothetical protein
VSLDALEATDRDLLVEASYRPATTPYRRLLAMTDKDTRTEGRLLSDFMGRIITLFPNRVEYTKKVFLRVKNESILLPDISEVRVDYVDGMTKGKGYVRIKTNDGKKHDLGLTTKAREVHEAIVAAL